MRRVEYRRSPLRAVPGVRAQHLPVCGARLPLQVAQAPPRAQIATVVAVVQGLFTVRVARVQDLLPVQVAAGGVALVGQGVLRMLLLAVAVAASLQAAQQRALAAVVAVALPRREVPLPVHLEALAAAVLSRAERALLPALHRLSQRRRALPTAWAQAPYWTCQISD